MITKKVEVVLTNEEIDNAEPVQVVLEVYREGKPEDGVTYTIDYPKG